MAVKYTQIFHSNASQKYQNCYFWYENIHILQPWQGAPVETVRSVRRPLPLVLHGQPLVHLLGHVQRRVLVGRRTLQDGAPGTE
jgi:hypothetical protein